MKKLIWLATFAGVAVWSLLAWAAHGLVGVAGNLASSNSDILPVPAEWIEFMSWLAILGANVGEWLVVAIWGLVSLGIVGLGYVGARLADRRRADRFMEARS